MKLYRELAEYYYDIEKVGRNFDDEIDFLFRTFQEHRIKSIIDLGCGTGEHVSALHKRGFKTKGVDVSETMIGVARKRYPDCDFILADLQNFKVDNSVDAVICIFGTFNYIIKDEDITTSLNNVYALLPKQGIFILEIWNSYPVQKIKKKPISPVSLSKIGDTMIKRNRGFRVAEGRDGLPNLVEVNFIFNLNQEIIKDRHIMRVYAYEEITEILQNSGFEIISSFGNYKMEKFQDNAGRMVLVCKRGK